MPHRILHIIPTLDRAGAEKQLALLAAGLPKDRYEVHVCALTHGGPLVEPLERAGIPVAVIGKRWKVDPLSFARLRKYIAQLKPDLVHTWMFTAGGYGRVAAASAGVRRLVNTERCVNPWKSGWQWWLDRRLAPRTGRIVVNSQGVRDDCLAHGLPADRLQVIPNGVPPATPSEVTKAALLAELGLPPGVKLIGAVGRLWPQKRVKDLMWVMELLRILHQDVHMLIIGDGPQRAMLERYRILIEAESYIHFLGARNDVPRIMPHFDLLWLGSGYEGMPNSVMEAMAAGVPVVATDIPGTRELVVHGETGYLCPIRGRKEFCRYTDELIRNPALARQLGEAGRRRVVTEFPVERMIERHDQLYRELLA